MVAVSSMTSRGYVSHQMIRSLCCRANKVDDVDDTVVIKDTYVDTIFIFFSNNVLGRSLLGRFITALEEKNLASQTIIFTTITAAKINSSALFRNFSLKANSVGVFTIWKGQDAYKRSEEAITRVGNQHSVNRSDVLFTTSSAQTRKEVGLLMTEYLNDSRDTMKANGKADDKSNDQADVKPENVEEVPAPAVIIDAENVGGVSALPAVAQPTIQSATDIDASNTSTPPLPTSQFSSDNAITADDDDAPKAATPPPPPAQQ